MNYRGSPQGNTSRAANTAERGTNQTLAPRPHPSRVGPLTEIQERLPTALHIAAPDAVQQNVEFCALSNRVVEESGGNQLWISKVMPERGNG
ncbi:hypothetical protein HOY80DRAFT_988424 [Tuber brumale]|nr:hypothetical protein HOY80DRAFT_988424 [Tuber brumale]